jgi:MFS family permease
MPTQSIGNILSRSFVLTFFAQFGLLSTFYILMPTLPIYLSGSGSNKIEIGILIGIFTLSSIVLRPFIGRALLRTSEKRFMIIGTFLFVLTSLAYLIAPPFWPLLVVRFFQGIGFAFYHTASFTLIANISPETQKGQSLSYFVLASTVSGAIAPPIGIIVINHFSFSFLFLICSGLSLCSFFISTLLRTKPVTLSKNFPNDSGSLISREALPPSIINFLSFFVWGALNAFFPLYAINHGMANPGLFFTILAMILILGRSIGGKIFDLYSKEKIILPCLAMGIMAMIILAFSKTVSMFILVAVVWGIGFAFLTPSLLAYALDQSGSSSGPAMGTFTAFSDVGLTFGPVMMGIILHSTNYSIMFLCLAFTGLINLSYFYFFVKKGGSLPP